jgi:hypothetical protein
MAKETAGTVHYARFRFTLHVFGLMVQEIIGLAILGLIRQTLRASVTQETSLTARENS